jgi:hypothetical protein
VEAEGSSEPLVTFYHSKWHHRLIFIVNKLQVIIVIIIVIIVIIICNAFSMDIAGVCALIRTGITQFSNELRAGRPGFDSQQG